MVSVIRKKLPPIGLRIIKSALAVFLCYMVNLLRNGDGIVFYSQLAALWCMQDYVKESKQKAYQRTIGTIIGALYGLVVLVIFGYIKIDKPACNILECVVISMMIAVIIYTTVLINKKNASYFSCVVFLSIVVNHISDVNPYLFVWNRFLDTIIGILLGMAVNCFRLPCTRRNDILFISGLDDTLLNAKDNLSGYSRVELNRMIEEGALFTISTMRTPASLMEPLKDISLKLPLIVMDGAALYDINDKRYVKAYVISHDRAKRIINFMHDKKMHWFTNVIIDDMLVIYYQETEDEMYNKLISSLRRSPYRNYVKRELPEEEEVVYFMLIDKKDCIDSFYDELLAAGLLEDMKVLKYASHDYAGYSYIKIYNHNAIKENMIDYLKAELGVDRAVTFGSIEGRYTHIVEPGDSNGVVRTMKKEYERKLLPIPIKTRQKV
ncbi:MAG: HAD hydrolase family protein [Lachnospiraceae bacterium]|nr:HAD hydrolase family protein [Lachnospiraceae bacterium]